MTAHTQLVPIGGYYKHSAVKDMPYWVTSHYDVRLYLGVKIIRQESFSSYKAAKEYCAWLDEGLVTCRGNNSTEA